MNRPESLRFASFGVGVAVEATEASHLDWVRSRLDMLLPGHVEAIGDHPVEHVFSIDASQAGAAALYLDGKPIAENSSTDGVLEYLCTRIKLTVTGNTGARVVVHAGVVGIGRLAVVLPAHGFHGKTTLVRTLVARGATYYSDDLAVFDTGGLVHPFAKTLSLRGLTDDPYLQVEHTVESLGGVAGEHPLPVGLVLFTKFVPDGVWAPRPITPAQATLKLAEHTLNLRAHPRLALGVLRTMVTGGAFLWESDRGDAEEVAERVFQALLGPVADR